MPTSLSEVTSARILTVGVKLLDEARKHRVGTSTSADELFLKDVALLIRFHARRHLRDPLYVHSTMSEASEDACEELDAFVRCIEDYDPSYVETHEIKEFLDKYAGSRDEETVLRSPRALSSDRILVAGVYLLRRCCPGAAEDDYFDRMLMSDVQNGICGDGRRILRNLRDSEQDISDDLRKSMNELETFIDALAPYRPKDNDAESRERELWLATLVDRYA